MGGPSGNALWLGLNVDPAAREVERAFALAREADRLGLELIGVQDHPYNRAFLDTWTLLVALGVATRRVRLFTNVASLPLRPPAMLAKAAATLDRLTGGRVELGLGAGAMWDAIAAYGGPRRRPGEAVAALEEALAVMPLLWQEPTGQQTVDFAGTHYSLRGARPGPAPAHPIRIWLGALQPRLLALTGRSADGWIISTTYISPEEVPARLAVIEQAAREAGRDPMAIRRGYNVMGGIVPAGERRLSARQPGVMIATAAEWVETLTRYAADLGFDTFIYWPVVGESADQARRFAEEVVPRVREALGQAAPSPGSAPARAADAVDEASIESFPASDPPGWIPERS